MAARNCLLLLGTFVLLLSAVNCHVDDALSDEIVVQLGEADLNAIKSGELCSSDQGGEDCFLAFLPEAVRDAVSLAMEGTLEGQCFRVSEFIADETDPELAWFVELDLNQGVLLLNFTEVIRTDSANFTALRLQSSFDTFGQVYTLTPGDVLGPLFSTNITLQVNMDDLNIVKGNSELCTRESNCWIHFSEAFLVDIAGNSIKAIVDGDPSLQRRALRVIADVTSPELVAFDVDLDAAEVTFFFDETIAQILFDRTRVVFSASANVSANYSLTNIRALTAEEPATSFTIELDADDVIALKAIDNFFTDENNTFLTYDALLIEDRSGNQVEPRRAGMNALQARNFTPDSTPPIAVTFDLLDLDTDRMQVTFDEPVEILSLNFSRVSLRSAALTPAVEISLTGANNVRYLTADRRIIEILFNSLDISRIKLQRMIAISEDTSFLFLEAGAIEDTSGNAVEATAEAIQVEVLIEDSRGPMLLSFNLNLTSAMLSLTFDDIIDVGSLVVGEITVQADRDGLSGSEYTLTDSSSSSVDGFSLVIDLSITDSNGIKAIPDLASNENNTFLSFTAATLDNIFNANVISVVPTDAIQVEVFYPDRIRPQLQRFDINYNTEALTLVFDETVDLGSFDASQITLHNLANDAIRSLTLTAAIVQSGRYVTFFDVELSREDLNFLKSFTDFAVSRPTTFLSMTQATITDANGNSVVAIPDTAAEMVSTFTSDSTFPVLLSFNLDMDIGQLQITFDEVVNAATFQPDQVQIQAAAIVDSPTSFYRLTGGQSSDVNSPIIYVNISIPDLNAIKRNLEIATSMEDTFISLSSTVVEDMNGVNYDNASQIQVFQFTSDTTRPELDSFTLDLNLGLVSLTFCETVDSTSLDISAITLLSSDNSSGNATDPVEMRTLTPPGTAPEGSFTNSLNSTVIVITLGSDDLDEIKRLTGLGISIDDTFISIANTTILDMNGNNVVAIDTTDPLQAFDVVFDVIPPELVAFSLDMDGTVGTLMLSFSETVNATSLDISAITLLSNYTTPAMMYTLNDSIGQMEDAVVLTVTLGEEDFNLIKFRSSLAVDLQSTFLRLDNMAIADTSDNYYMNETAVFQVPFGEFTRDMTRPEIASFSLDIDSGILTLTFSEVINSSSLGVSSIELLDLLLFPSSTFRLTGGSLSGPNTIRGHPPVIDITLLTDDLNAIKQRTLLAVSNISAFLSISDNAAFDFAAMPNPLVGVPISSAIIAEEFTEDSTEPELVDFDIDLTAEQLLLVFNETVDINTFDVSGVTLQSDSDLFLSTANYTLTTSFAITTQDSTDVAIRLEREDLNAIKLLTALCTSENNCFISITNDTILDMNSNPVTEIASDQGRMVRNFTEDETQPILDSFSLDMDIGELSLTFSEPVNVESLNLTALLLQAYPGANETDSTHVLTPGLYPEFTDTQSGNGLVLTIRIGFTDLYDLQRKRFLATDNTNTFLSLDAGTVLDTNDLEVVGIPANESIPVMGFIEDTTAPDLVSFTLDLNVGSLILTFSETVDVGSLRPDALTLFATNETMTFPQLTLSATSPVQLFDDPIVNINLTKADLDELKLFEDLGTEVENTFLHVMLNAVRDNARFVGANGILPNTIQASGVEPDITEPMLEDFDIDLNTGLLVLYFDETVNSSSIDFEAITFLNHEDDANATSFYTLTNGTVQNGDGTAITVNLTVEDLNAIKVRDDLLVSLNTSYISVMSELIADMAQNQLSPPLVNLQAQTLTLDTGGPSLVAFSLDMNLGTITLEFNEPVNISTISFVEITLAQGSVPGPNVTFYNLQGGVPISTSNGEVFEFEILEDDLNELKRLQIGSSRVTTFITFTQDTILDIAGNQVLPVMVRPVTDYTEDSTPPDIDMFDLNLTSNTLDLYFTETIRARSLDVTFITVQDQLGTVSYTLTDASSSTSPDGTALTIDLGREDLNAVKLLEGLATSPENTYLSYTFEAIMDRFGNAVENRSADMALPVNNYTADFIAPELEGFSLDLTNETLTLSFSETVNASTFDPTAITIQSSRDLTSLDTAYVTLSEGVVGGNNFTLEVILMTPDLNELKRLLELATRMENTFISISPELIEDMNGNPIVPISNTSATMAAEVLEDLVPPMLDGFSLNLNTSELTLTFSETVAAPTLNIGSFVLQDDSNSTNYYRLTDGEVVSDNSSIIVVNVSKTDIDLIKENFNLATEVGNTFVRLDSSAVDDMNGNGVVEIENGFAIPADGYIPDTTPPELLNYTLDLNRGEINLVFSETVNAQSIEFTELTLLNETTLGNDTEFYALTEGSVSMRNFTGVTIFLVAEDLNTIKALLTLGTSIDDTFLSITSFFIEDMNGIPIVPISEEEPAQAFDVLPDVTEPSLVGFSINLTSDVLTLSFSETVSAESFDQSAVTLYNTPSGAINHTLVDSSVDPLVDFTEILVQISTNDVNEIKRLDFATSENDTYIAIEPNGISDTNGNLVERITPENALSVTDYFEDQLNPTLESFNFNLSSGEIALTFSETVNATTLDVAGFTVLAMRNDSNISSTTGLYQLTNVSTSSQENSHILTITIADENDLNLIKRDTTLAVSNTTTFLSIEFGSVLDMNNNPVIEISFEDTLPVTEYTDDFIAPELLAFNLYLTPGTTDLILELVFSETVNASSVQPQGFAFSNTRSMENDTRLFMLTGGGVSQLDSTIVTIAITESDLESIRQLDATFLLTLPETSYIAVGPGSVLDMAGNAILPIPVGVALNINGSFADLNPPVLESFTLDVNLGMLHLLFSEAVLSSTFIPTRLTLHSGATVAFNSTTGSFLTLAGATNVTTTTSPDRSVLSFNIIDEDLNEIKRMTELAISRQTTYLSFERGVILDESLNEAVLIPENNAQQATVYIRDETGPELVSFDIDLTSEIATFTFTETVNASTVDVSQMTFQNSISSANRFYTLTNSEIISNDSTVLVLQFSEEDSNGIKAIDGLLTSRFNTFLAIDREALLDLAGNELIDIFPNNALNVANYTADTIRPELLNFTIDLNFGFIVLTFDETVRETTLDAEQITLVDSANNSVYNLTLTNGISNLDISHIVNISFSLVDLNELKRLPFCTTMFDCYLSFTQDLVLDMVGLAVVERPLDFAALPAEFIPDETAPVLLEFATIDFDREVIILQFSETLNTDTFNISDITLQSLFANPISTVPLTSGSIPLVNTSLLELSFDQNDLDAVKLNSQVCVFRGNCYISFTSALIEDVNGNLVEPAGNSFPGFLAARFIPDSIRPELLAFDLDLELGTAQFEFSEPIDYESIVFEDIAFQGVQNSSENITATILFPLSDTEITIVNSRNILLQLATTDVERLKASRYFMDENTTYLSVLETAATDVAFNPNAIVEIPSEDALIVRNFTEDQDGPILASFILDYSTNQLLLMFNEPILPESFNFTGISFRNQPNITGSEIYTLTGGNISNTFEELAGLMDVVIELTQADSTALKASLTLATEAGNTLISLATDTVLNTFGEANMPINGLPAEEVETDFTELEIDSFLLDVNAGLLILSFNDVVRSDTFDPRGIIIQNAPNSQDQFRYQLTEDSMNFSPDGFSLTIVIGENDLNSIKSNTELASNENNTYLTLRASAVEDVFGTDIIAVTNGNALSVSEYISDSTPPLLLNYTLDVDAGTVDLTFSEAVDERTFLVSGLRLLNDANASNMSVPDEYLSFDTASSFVALSRTEIRVTITQADLNALKQLTNLATDGSNTFLEVVEDAIFDYAGNGFNETEALEDGEFVADGTNPELLSFELNLDTGTLMLFFSETVNASSLDVTMISFQSMEIFRTGEVYSLTNSVVELFNAPVISVSLSTEDSNALKQLENIANDLTSTFLTLGENAIVDMNDNPVETILDIAALPASNYTQDITRPVLERFGLNLTDDTLTLYFSETVETSTLDVSQITLHSMQTGGEVVVLIGGFTTSLDGPVVVIELPTFELNILKTNEDFATSTMNIFLSLTAATIQDTDENPVVPISPLTPLPTAEFQPDFTSPVLEGFDFDANQGVLTLSFSETVRVNTFNASAIILQNSTTDNFVEYQLESAFVIGSSNQAVVEVQISDEDRDEIKSSLELATRRGSTFIRIDSSVIEDMNGNSAESISPSDALLVSNYTVDQTSPDLLDFMLNLNTSELFLTFSETVDASSVDIRAITVLSGPNENATSVQLTRGVVSNIDSTSITITLSREDTDELKRFSDLATSANNTFITLTSQAAADIDGNQVNPIAAEDAISTADFVRDEVPPLLEFFSFDANLGRLILTFSETVNASSFDPTQVLIQSQEDSFNLTDSFILTGGEVISQDDPIVVLQLSIEDQNTIKSLTTLAQSENNTFISLSNATVLDTFDNFGIAINESSALQVQPGGYTADRTRPELVAFELNLDTAELYLQFSETVNADTLRVEALTITTSAGNANNTYTLTLGVPFSINDTDVLVILSDQDLNSIKLDRSIATMLNNTAISIASLAIQDTALEPNFVVPASINASDFTEDSTPPTLSFWTIDVNASELVLNFDEAVERDSLSFAAITFQSLSNITNATAFGELYTLTGGTSSSDDGLQIVVQITEEDLNVIKEMLELLRGNSSSFISIDSTLIDDMNGNAIVAIPRDDAIPAVSYTNDTTAPRLRDFYLDMDSGNLTLSFSEAVNASSFYFPGVIIQNQANHSQIGGVFYMLTSGTVLSDDGPILELMISRDDLNELKRLEIAHNRVTTWITLSNMTVEDIEGNVLIPLENGATARQILYANYLFDVTGPMLEMFDIDLTFEDLTLYFSETVRTSTLDITQITLYSAANDSLASDYTLTGSSQVVDFTLENVTIILGLEDLNEIKRISTLATSENTTFISITGTTVQDTRANLNFEVPLENAVRVSNFTADLTPPELERFDLNLTSDTLTLYFSETVNASSLDPSQITFVENADGSGAAYTLRAGSPVIRDDPVVTVSLDNDDLNVIKILFTLATEQQNTFISITNQTVLDMNDNQVVSISLANASRVEEYFEDLDPPDLLAFNLDLDASILMLYFSETVNSQTFNATAITLQDGRLADDSFTLTDGLTESLNDSVIVVNITLEDLNYLKQNTSLVTSDADSYISITEFLIRDMNGNRVVAIQDGAALMIANHTEDITPPELLAWQLDMDEGRVSLTFSETVNANSFDPSQITIQAADFVEFANQSHTLTGGNSTEENITVIEFDILRDLTENPDDLNELKRLTLIATSMNDTYISFTSNLLVDMNGVPIVALPNGQAVQVENFTEDTTPPFLHAFDIDMNTGELILTFNETLNRDSLNIMAFTLQEEPNRQVPTEVDFFMYGVNFTRILNRTNSVLNLTLANGTSAEGDRQVFRLALTFEDLNYLKRIDICTEANRQGDCFLSFQDNAFVDMNNNRVVPVDIEEAEQARIFIPDRNPPSLTNFVQIDFNLNTIQLEFNETFNITSFDPANITLQRWTFDDSATRGIPFEQYTLTGGTNPIQLDDINLRFTITDTDVYRIKQMTLLCTRNNNCFIRYGEGLIRDMAGNVIVPLVDDFAALPFETPTFYEDDMVPPTLVSYELDMNNGNVTLTFDDVVSVRNLLANFITFYDASENDTESFTLTGQRATTEITVDFLFAQFYITEDDLIELKFREALLISLNTTWLENDDLLIEDVGDNLAFVRNETNRLQASNFSPDFTPPLLDFFEFHLEEKTVTLVANEPIFLPSVDPIGVTLLSSSDISAPGTTFHTLTNGTVSYDQPDVFLKRRVQILITDEDLLQIQLDMNLAEDVSSTYISIENGTFEDMFGNAVIGIPPTNALQADRHFADSIAAQLISFTIDLDTGTLELTFDDTVLTNGTFNPSGITLQNSMDAENVTTSYTFTMGTFSDSPNGYNFTINLSADDLNAIKQDLDLATDINNTYIITAPRGNSPVFDTSDNPLAELSIGLQPLAFTADTSRPNLVYYDIDLDSGTLTLVFNETVRARTFNITNLFIGSSANYSEAAYVYQLTSTNSTQEDLTTITVFFSIEDLNELKRTSPGLATSENDTFLAFDNDTLLDMNMNNVVEVDMEDARMVQMFTEDETSPQLVGFNFDLTDEVLTLTFDETVDASTFEANVITLYSHQNSSLSMEYTLLAGISSRNDSTVIELQLDFDDLNEIKSRRELAVNSGSTLISITDALIMDMNGNRVVPITQSEALTVTNYTEDTILPQLSSFDIDLSNDLIILTFSETIRPESLNLALISFTDSVDVRNRSLVYALTGGNQTFQDTRFLNITLNKVDSDQIRFFSEILTNTTTSIIVLQRGAIQDMNLNPVNATNLEVTNFFGDEVPPMFVSFDLDLNLGILTLSFSETVSNSSLDPTQITLQDSSFLPGINGSHTLTGGTSLSDDNTSIAIRLTDFDLNEIKRLEPLATGENNTFIALTTFAIQDTNGNMLVEVQSTEARPVGVLDEDFTNPELVSFNLDLDSGEIFLTFSETVRASTLIAEEFTLQSSRNESESSYAAYNFTAESGTIGANSFELALTISLADLNILKQMLGLATDNSNAFLSLSSDAVRDMFNNPVLSINTTQALSVSTYTEDSTPPTLEAYSFNVNTQELTLSFSETVNASSLNISGIVFQADRNGLQNETSHRLSFANTSTVSVNGPEIVVFISRDDLNAIKLIPELATTENNTFLSIDSFTIEDTVGLRVMNITSEEALPVSSYIPDSFGPVLFGFNLNLTSEILTLTFDETVNATSIFLAGFILHPTNVTSPDGIPLTGSTVLSMDSPVIEILLDTDELNLVKLRTDLATQRENTYLEIQPGNVQDLSVDRNNNPFTYEAVEAFSEDTTPPMITSFSIDLSNGTITLEFDEPVNRNSLSFSAITFQSAANISMGTFFTLTGGTSDGPNSTQLQIDILAEDLNRIKQDEELFRNGSTAFISFGRDLVSDMNNNPVVRVPSDNAEPVRMFIDDIVRPRLSFFDLDMNTGELTLVFTETMDVSTLVFQELNLQLLPSIVNPIHGYNLTGGSLLSAVDDTEVLIQITDFDLNELKRRGIALTADTTWLTFSNSTIQDNAGQYSHGLFNDIMAAPVSMYTPDTDEISLDYFTLDLTAERLILFLSEAVNTMTQLDVTQISLQSRSNDSIPGTEVFNLTTTSTIVPTVGAAMIVDAQTSAVGSGSGVEVEVVLIEDFPGSDSRVVVIQLSTTDLNEIKRLPNLATIRRNTVFIALSDMTVLDTFANMNTPIPSMLAVEAQTFMADTVPPVLSSYDLNLSTDQLTLSFSETVNVQTLNVSAFSLVSGFAGASYQLTAGEILTDNDPVVVIQLLQIDTDIIRNITELAVSPLSTFLSVTSSGIMDMNGNEVVSVNLQPVQVYVPDMVQPNLTSFHLDLDQGILYFTFSETVNVSSLDPTQFTLQSSLDVNSTSYALTGGDLQDYNSPDISLTITDEDLNQIKFYWDLATSQFDTFLSFPMEALEDMAGNPVTAEPVDSPQQAAQYTPDDTRPELLFFTYDADAGNLTLTFSETVNVDSFDPSALTLQSEPSMPDSNGSYTLTGGVVLTGNSTVLLLQLTDSDLNEVKRLSELATFENNTFITISPLLVDDMNGNAVVEIQPPQSLFSDNFTIDDTRPQLEYFDIDLDEGTLTLQFDETVNRSSLDFTQLTLISAAFSPNTSISLTLTGGTSPSTDNTQLVIEFSFEDLNEIKRLSLCDFDMDGEDCYLNLTEFTVADMVENFILPSDDPVRPRVYTADTTPPFLVAFSEFSYPNETITLTFSEIIDFSTFDASEISLQTFFTILEGDVTASLTGGIIRGSDSHVVTITILEPDVDTIKRNPTLCFRRNTCWLALSSATLLDLANNTVVTVETSRAEYSEEFIVDEQSPYLEYFDLSVEEDELRLFFNEPVDVEFFDPTAITLLSGVSGKCMLMSLHNAYSLACTMHTVLLGSCVLVLPILG